MNEKTEKIVEKGILMLPLVAALFWMGNFVISSQGQPETGAMMSPVRVDAVVSALFVFIIVYAIVLGVIFYRMNKALHTQLGANPVSVSRPAPVETQQSAPAKPAKAAKSAFPKKKSKKK
jgi:hypothetical protein